MTKPFVQSYKYDSLYRITEAKEMNDTQQTWIQTYDYDRYGNRTAFSQNIDGQNLAINNVTLPTVDTNTNRFNDQQGYEYDNIGNLTKDVTANQSRDIKFNGDNKQVEIKDATTGYKIGEYSYDGSGKRVKKRTFDANGIAKEDVIFVYSGDKLVAEYSTLPPPTNPTTKYVATDTLGSIRAMTNEYGEVVSRRDFMPFGEELQADATYRKANLKYNPDDVRQKFTGYQKDEETGLDFAEARMYNNAHARFTAVDPLLASGKSTDPQTFNRYVYVVNNPLRYVDPDGLQVSTSTKRIQVNANKIKIPRRIMEMASEKLVSVSPGKTRKYILNGGRLLGVKRQLVRQAYKMQSAISNQNYANSKVGDGVPKTRTTSTSKEKHSSETVSDTTSSKVNISTAPNVEIGVSKTKSATKGEASKDGTNTTEGIIDTTEAQNLLESDINLTITNFIVNNKEIAKDGYEYIDIGGSHVSASSVERHLRDFTGRVQNIARCERNPRICARNAESGTSQ